MGFEVGIWNGGCLESARQRDSWLHFGQQRLSCHMLVGQRALRVTPTHGYARDQ